MRSAIPAFLIAAAAASAEESAQLTEGDSRIDITFSEAVSDPLRSAVLNWIADGSRAVTNYHTRFPVDRLRIRILGYVS